MWFARIVLDHRSPGSSDKDLLEKCLIAYTFAALIKDEGFAFRAFSALCDLKFLWEHFSDLVGRGQTCYSKAAEDLVSTFLYQAIDLSVKIDILTGLICDSYISGRPIAALHWTDSTKSLRVSPTDIQTTLPASVMRAGFGPISPE